MGNFIGKINLLVLSAILANRVYASAGRNYNLNQENILRSDRVTDMLPNSQDNNPKYMPAILEETNNFIGYNDNERVCIEMYNDINVAFLAIPLTNQEENIFPNILFTANNLSIRIRNFGGRDTFVLSGNVIDDIRRGNNAQYGHISVHVNNQDNRNDRVLEVLLRNNRDVSNEDEERGLEMVKGYLYRNHVNPDYIEALEELGYLKK